MSESDAQVLELGLSRTHAQEQFSRAFVIAVASLAGCSTAEPTPDVDDIDWTLSSRLKPLRPKLDLQVKSISNDLGTGTDIHYPLKRKNYDGLIHSDVLTRRLLVVVVVPPTPQTWVSMSPQQCILRNCAYWVSLAGMPPTDNDASVTVHVPRANIFDVAALIALMRESNKGGVS